MSHFDFPRIHVRGMISFNVGTANNDDYAQEKIEGLPLRLADTDQVQVEDWTKLDKEFVEWASNSVTAVNKDGEEKKRIPAEWNYYGDMGVALEFMDDKGKLSCVKVASIQTGPAAFIMSQGDLDTHSAKDQQLLNPFLGASLSFKKFPEDSPTRKDTHSTAIIIDCAQEGSSQSSQIFADNLLLVDAQKLPLLGRKLDDNGEYYKGGGQPSKASTLWMNFQRNVAFPGPGGASGTFQTVVKFGDDVESSKLKELFERYGSPGRGKIKGVVLRYNCFRVRGPYRDNLAELAELYKKKGLNPGIGEFIGTLAPWYEDDECETHVLGRLLVPPKAYGLERLLDDKVGLDPEKDAGAFKVPLKSDRNGTGFRLAPIVAHVHPGLVLSLDVVNTFPEHYQKSTSPTEFHEFAYDDDTDPGKTNNPKFKFDGTLALTLTPPGGKPVQVATLAFDGAPEDGKGYYGTTPYYTRGGMIDIQLRKQDYPGDLEKDLADGRLSLRLKEPKDDPNDASQGKELLVESELMVIPNQPTVYTEQVPGGIAEKFNFNGTEIPCSLSIAKKGKPIKAEDYGKLVQAGEGLVIKEFRLTPMQLADSEFIDPLTHHKVCSLDYQVNTRVDKAFTKLLAVTWKGMEAEASEGLQTQDQVDNLIHPLIYIRILPNEDYSQYYVKPDDLVPVGNDSLTFDVIYSRILRNYHLLYPAMSKAKALNDETNWKDAGAYKLLEATDPKVWPTLKYMPRTRDLSRTRRTLLRAWAEAHKESTPDSATAGAARPALAAKREDQAQPKPEGRVKPILR